MPTSISGNNRFCLSCTLLVIPHKKKREICLHLIYAQFSLCFVITTGFEFWEPFTDVRVSASFLGSCPVLKAFGVYDLTNRAIRAVQKNVP